MFSSSSVQFAGFAVGVFPALASYAAQELHAKSVGVIVPDIGVGIHAYKYYIQPVFSHFGVKDIREVLSNSQNPDYSSSVAAAAQGGPNVLLYVGNSSGCAPVMQARVQLGIQATLIVPGGCADPRLLKAAGADANGVYLNSDYYPVGSGNSDVVTFEAAMKKYGPPNVPMDEFTQEGFGSIINIQRAFSKIGVGHLTTASILREFRTGGDHPNFMTHPYTCNGHLVPGAPAICNAAQRILIIKNGKPTEVGGWYDGTPYIKP
jgi:branched-chain amino acid transport system substrate-binding protein